MFHNSFKYLEGENMKNQIKKFLVTSSFFLVSLNAYAAGTSHFTLTNVQDAKFAISETMGKKGISMNAKELYKYDLEKSMHLKQEVSAISFQKFANEDLLDVCLKMALLAIETGKSLVLDVRGSNVLAGCQYKTVFNPLKP